MSGIAKTADTAADPGYCLYGAKYLLTLVEALTGEIEGVRIAEDIEYVHRMRVATRRIRAALPLYRDCFSPKEYRRWRREIRAITRALGEARDADVQIDYLRGFLDHLGTAEPKTGEPVFLLGEGTPDTTDLPVQAEERAKTVPSPGLATRLRHVLSGIRARLSGKKPATVNPPADDTSGAFPPLNGWDQSTNRLRPGIECLILRLQQRREALQPEVIFALDHLVAEEVIEDMEDALRKVVVSGKLHHTDIHSPFAYEQAFFHISLCLEEIFSYDKYVHLPEKIEMHHAMRIAAKRLRYTMECFAALYDDDLKAQIKTVKNLQDILGDMHDCDVWADMLPEFMEEEKRRSEEYFGHERFFAFIKPGLVHLRETRMEERRNLYESLVTTWDSMKTEGAWEDLRATISAPLQGLMQGDRVRLNIDENEPIRIALLGDVHANLPALEAVLTDAKSRGATTIFNVGDFVGYGAFPEETVRLLKEEHAVSVIGNYDLNVIHVRGMKKKKKRSKQKRLSLKWAYKHLSRESRAYLRSLPRELRLNLAGTRIYLTHGSPKSVTDYITEETPAGKLRKYREMADADIIVTGHAHQPLAKEVDGTWFVNTGSVGRPDDGDPRACYALLQLNPFALYHFRVPYDIERAVTAIYKNKLPDSFARIFQEGRPLDIVKHYEESPEPQ